MNNFFSSQNFSTNTDNTNPYYQTNESLNNQKYFYDTTNATLPQKKIYVPSYTVIVNSRDRDFKLYPSPSDYKIGFGNTVYKNVTSIELKGSMIPRSSYNVYTGNNRIDFSIGSTVTAIKILNKGSGYTSVPEIYINPPSASGGIQATAEAILDVSTGSISNINITNPGSGYSASNPPYISIEGPKNTRTGTKAQLSIVIGTLYTAYLRVGEYTIGGNPTPPGTSGSGLIKELQDAMNYAYNGGNYVEGSVTPFEARLVSQYPTLNPTIGSPESANTNSTSFNRIQITNVDNVFWELLFGTGPNKKISAGNLLGFGSLDYSNPVSTAAVSTLISAGTTLRANFDYNLLDDPKFVLLSFRDGQHTFERLQSSDNNVNRKFATLLYDANFTDVIKDTTGTTTTVDDVIYLTGPVTKGTFWIPPGNLKPIKGFDFDAKKLSFATPIGKLDSLNILFTQYGMSFDNRTELYDFQGRDHILIFEIVAEDQASGERS